MTEADYDATLVWQLKDAVEKIRAGQFDAMELKLFNKKEDDLVRAWMKENAPDIKFSTRYYTFWLSL